MIRLTWSFPYAGSTARRTRLFFSAKVGVGISRENLRSRKIRHRDQHPDNREIEKDRIRLDAVLNFVILNYLMPYFLLNLSTRPLVSTSFCLPV